MYKKKPSHTYFYFITNPLFSGNCFVIKHRFMKIKWVSKIQKSVAKIRIDDNRISKESFLFILTIKFMHKTNPEDASKIMIVFEKQI